MPSGETKTIDKNDQADQRVEAVGADDIDRESLQNT